MANSKHLFYSLAGSFPLTMKDGVNCLWQYAVAINLQIDEQ